MPKKELNLLQFSAIHMAELGARAAEIHAVIDGAFSLRMLYGNSKLVPILSPAEAGLKSFQNARTQRRR